MSEDCNEDKKCSEENSLCDFTSGLVYDGGDLTCVNDAEFLISDNDKLNAILALYFSNICALKVTVGGLGDAFISNVELTGTDLVFTGSGGAFTGSISLAAFLDNTDTNDIDYINGASLTGTLLALTGVGNAGTSIDLAAIDGRFTGVSFDGTTLTFTGANSQPNLTVDISSVNTDTNDIDYINSASLTGTTLILSGIGNAGASVDLAPLISGLSGGSDDDDIIGRLGEATVATGGANKIVITAGVNGSKIENLLLSFISGAAGDSFTLIIKDSGGTTLSSYIINWDDLTKYTNFDLMEFLSFPKDEKGNRYLNIPASAYIEISAPSTIGASVKVSAYIIDF